MAKPFNSDSIVPDFLNPSQLGGTPGGFGQNPAALVPKPTVAAKPVPVKPMAVPTSAASTAFNPGNIDPRNGPAAPAAARGEQIDTGGGIDPLGELGQFLESLFSGAFGGQSQAPAGQTWDPLQGYVPEIKPGTPSRTP